MTVVFTLAGVMLISLALGERFLTGFPRQGNCRAAVPIDRLFRAYAADHLYDSQPSLSG